MSNVEQSTHNFTNFIQTFLQTKTKKKKSCYKSELKMSFSSLSLSSVKRKIHRYSQPLNYLLIEAKEGFIKWERCQHVKAKLQKMLVCPGNVTLVTERIWLKEALDRKETDFQKNCNTGLYV